MKAIKKSISITLVFSLFLGTLSVICPYIFRGKASTTVPAIASTQKMQAYQYGGGTVGIDIDKYIPVYSIIQDNGWGANYVKLRDIAFYMDFGVEWSAEKPNEMRIYTNKHYLEPLNSTGPATEDKVATKSTMDMYVDDVKVDVDAYIIDNNNYFKVRDLAKVVNFACIYSMAAAKEGLVALNANYPYVDGDLVFTAVNYPNKRTINYEEFTPWYDASSGIHNEPVVNRRDNPWARMDYYAKYGAEALGSSDRFNDFKTENQSVFNAVIQTIIDWDIIKSNQSGAYVEGKFVEGLNPNYMYPIVKLPTREEQQSDIPHVSWIKDFTVEYFDKSEGIGILVPYLYEDSPRIGHSGYSVSLSMAKSQTSSIISKMNSFKTDREKITFLANEVCNRIKYQDFDERTLPSVFEAIKNGTFWNDNTNCGGVCEDYTEAFTILCSAGGYDSIHQRSMTHAWNEVFLPDEGRWVVIDCTWGKVDNKYIGMDIATYYEKENVTLFRSQRIIEAAHQAKLAGE